MKGLSLDFLSRTAPNGFQIRRHAVPAFAQRRWCDKKNSPRQRPGGMHNSQKFPLKILEVIFHGDNILWPCLVPLLRGLAPPANSIFKLYWKQ